MIVLIPSFPINWIQKFLSSNKSRQVFIDEELSRLMHKCFRPVHIMPFRCRNEKGKEQCQAHQLLYPRNILCIQTGRDQDSSTYGLINTLSRSHKGLLLGKGSTVTTSKAAPFSCFDDNASIKASSSTTGPLPKLINTALDCT